MIMSARFAKILVFVPNIFNRCDGIIFAGASGSESEFFILSMIMSHDSCVIGKILKPGYPRDPDREFV